MCAVCERIYFHPVAYIWREIARTSAADDLQLPVSSTKHRLHNNEHILRLSAHVGASFFLLTFLQVLQVTEIVFTAHTLRPKAIPKQDSLALTLRGNTDHGPPFLFPKDLDLLITAGLAKGDGVTWLGYPPLPPFPDLGGGGSLGLGIHPSPSHRQDLPRLDPGHDMDRRYPTPRQEDLDRTCPGNFHSKHLLLDPVHILNPLVEPGVLKHTPQNAYLQGQ